MATELARGLAVWFTLACAALAAEDPQDGIQVWTDASGRFSVQAEFVRAEYSQDKKSLLVYARRTWSSSRRLETRRIRLSRFDSRFAARGHGRRSRFWEQDATATLRRKSRSLVPVA